MKRQHLGLIILFAILLVRNGAAETEEIADRVSYLPGFGFVSNIELAGYLEVDRSTNSNSFYWFVEGNKTNNQFPLGTIVWLNGGPGCSSLIGLFEELGPYQIEEDTENKEFPYKLVQNINSWSQKMNVLFVDQPVGTGFSISDPDGLVTNEEQVAENFYSILCQFFTRIHPEYSPSDVNPFFLAGESYAGKYIPNIAKRILQGGDYRDSTGAMNGCNNLHLSGIAIGDGLVDPFWQRSAYPDEAFGVSLINSYQHEQAQVIANKCKQELQLGLTDYGANSCNKIDEFIHSAAGNFTNYDVRSWQPEYNDDLLVGYLNRFEVQQALHIDTLFGGHTFTPCSDEVFEALKDDVYISSKDLFVELLENGIRVLLYNGQFDYQDGPLGTERWLETLDWSGKDKFEKAPRLQWLVRGQIAGYVRSYENLSFLIVNNAGHFVPMDQPENSLDMITHFVSGAAFAADPDYVFSNKLCSYLSDCGSKFDPPHGYCEKGRCVCNDNFSGFDCSFPINQFSTSFPITHSASLLPLSWNFYRLEVLNQTNLSFSLKTNDSANSVFSFYLNLDSTPTPENYLISTKSNLFIGNPFIGITMIPGEWYIGIYNEFGGTRFYSLTVSEDNSFDYQDGSVNEQKSKLSWAVVVLSVLLFITLFLLITTNAYTLWKSTKTKKTINASAWQNDL